MVEFLRKAGDDDEGIEMIACRNLFSLVRLEGSLK
jgi:hypothetical protein